MEREQVSPASIAVLGLGHVAFYVRDLDASRRFYRDVLGLRETGTGKDGRIVFFSVRGDDRHHVVACELAHAAGPGPQPQGVPGVYHVAFAVGASLAELDAARRWVASHGFVPFGETGRSFCVRDPDGHTIELYADAD